MYSWLEPYIHKKIGSDHCGFQKGRGTIDHIFSLRQNSKDFWSQNQYAKLVYGLLSSIL